MALVHVCREVHNDVVMMKKDPEDKVFSLYIRNDYDEVEQVYDIKFCPYCGAKLEDVAKPLYGDKLQELWENREDGYGKENDAFLD